MINFIYFVVYINIAAGQSFKVQLQSSNPLFMDCKDISQIKNGFYGEQYFYDRLSQSGTYTNLDKITFFLWFNVHSKMILNGRQILFSLVDGYGPDQVLNLMLMYQKDKNNQYSISVLNERLLPEKKKLAITSSNDLFMGSWNYLLLSIDQTQGDIFLNIKFFSTYDLKLQQTTDVLPSQKFIYSFGPHSRITNEQLYEQTSDYKACVNIANFYYINGWSTMDSEIYADYVLDLKFLLRPYNTSLTPNMVKFIKSTKSVEFSGPVGINVYKNTQIVYSFTEQLSSFTIGFWIKFQNIVLDFQVLSLTDDLIQKTSIGFGVNKAKNLLLYQVFSNKIIGTLEQKKWKHITAAALEVSLDKNFLPTNQQKFLRVFVDQKEVYNALFLNFLAYKRLVVGPVKIDTKRLEVIDIQDIKVFSGFGIIQSSTDCQLFVGEYCLLCKDGTHYCAEQNPYNDTYIYNCPAGYKETNSGCQQISQLNCLRVSNTSQCIVCKDGYNLVLGACQINQLYVYKPYNCTDYNALYCEQQNFESVFTNSATKITTINLQSVQFSKLCNKQIKSYDPQTFTCSKNEINNCQQSQYSSICNKCLDGYYVTSSKICTRTCALGGIYKFRDSNINNNNCVQYCPVRYNFAITCNTGAGISDYYCDSRKDCGLGELDLKYICIKQEFSQIGKSQSCKITLRGIIYVNFNCKSPCKYCYGQADSQCLGCYPGYYFTPYLSSCLKKCSDQQNKFIYHNPFKMVCEYQCPNDLLQQGLYCVTTCDEGYSKFQNKCIPINSVEVYFDEDKQQMFLCPLLCKTCSSSTYCLSCINEYPYYDGKCYFNCYPFVAATINNVPICKEDCYQDELVYENADFQGYQIKQCFQKFCGTIQAGGVYQTFKHQTNPKLCTLPCDDGYYGNVNSAQCVKCSDQCQKCKDFENFCTACYPSQFLLNNACFQNCGDKYQNYINFECEGSCSQGVALIDQQEGILACVSNCGDIFADYKYRLNGQCIKEKPEDGVYCEGYNCYSCNALCKNCIGQFDTDCLECYDNYFFNAGTCVLDCGNLKYDKINWVCVSECPSNLCESSGYEMVIDDLKLITSCFLTCLYNKYQFKGKCYDYKPNNCYCEQRTNYIFCEKCSQQCLTCVTAFSNSCSVCNAHAFLRNTDCFYDCPTDAPLKDLISSRCVVQCQYYSLDGYCVQYCDSKTYKYLAKNACYSTGCPLGTYNQYSTYYCYACYTGCSTCTDGSNYNCQTCFDGYFLDQGKSCVQKCQTKLDLLQDWVNGKCVQYCPSGSYLQQLSDGALACKELCPKYYYSNICVQSCPSQSFLVGEKCLNCAGPCSVCYGTEVDQCTQCDQGYYRDDTTCYQQCPQSKPYINIDDQTCIENCSTYLYLSQMICFTSCPSFLYIYELNGKKECVEECYIKSYLSNGHCYECDPICKQCFGPNNGNCLECEQPYYLDLQTCQLLCPQFYDTIDKVCKDACPVNLVAQEQLCQQNCDDGYLIYHQNCLETCPTFTYREENFCLDCNLLCQTCFGESENQCNSCIQNYFLNGNTCQLNCDKFYDFEERKCKVDCGNKLEFTDQMQCISNCPSNYIKCQSKCILTPPDGYYSDGIQCQKCNDKCSKCVSSTSCTECQKNYYLDQDQCENKCSNQYLFMDTINRLCVTKCSSNLYHLLSFDKRFCVINCTNKFDNWCVDSCALDMYSDNKICKYCSNNCLECESLTKCNKCKSGYYLENDQCLTSCSINKTDRVNIKCVTECDQSLYTYQQECISKCPTNPLTYQYQMTCHNSCPIRTYLDEQSCYDCHQNCLTCIGPTNNNCITCADGYYLDNQICTNTCPQLYDQVNFKCVNTCPISLFQESNNCIATCPKYQYKENCVDECPSNTYQNLQKCFDCSSDCLICNANSCIKCQPPTYLSEGLCELSCPVFYDNTKNECVDICPEKTLKYLDNCYTECPNNTYVYNKECQLSCPLYMIPKARICVNCPERCSECLDDTVCILCLNSYYLYEGQCYVTCPLSKPYAHITQGSCLDSCKPDTYIKGYECVPQCNLLIFQNQCLEKCPSGYYGQDICKPCRSECKECNNYDICTSCNDNYFLESNQCDTQCTKIKDLKKQQCVGICDKLLYKNICYQQCPINTFEFGNICVVNCNDGYYGSDQFKCEKCPIECEFCQSNSQCSQCKVGFYLYQTKCLEECPEQLFSNPIQNLCQNSCPKRTYQFQNQCLFDCLDGYYKDDESFKCIENCSSQQYLDKKTCYQCSIECDGCYAYGNNYCIKCSKGFTLDENGYCLGSECKQGYFLQKQSCQKCQHKCLTCQDELECTKCRGTNRSKSDCSCAHGYYDDELYDDCQKCPCDECTSQTNCLSCKNNLQLPLCSCDRILNEDWCITCIEAKVNIYFSDNLNSIIVYFGYLVTANLLNPFQPSSCELWFDNSETFGANSTCYLSWDRYSIVIQLKPYSTIKVGDQLHFKNGFYRDIDKGLCDNYFIKTFIENKVYGPANLMKPYVLFSVPSFVSDCKVVEINQILLEGTGQRLQKVLNWQLDELENEDAFLQMDSFLASQQSEIKIPIGILSPNTTYTITTKYINMFDRVNFTKFQFTTLPIQAPYVYLSFNPLKVNIYVFDCHITYKNMENQFSIQIQIEDSKNDTNVYISQQLQMNPPHEVLLNESLLPNEQALLFIATTASSIIKEVFTLESQNIDVKFLQPDRFIGQDSNINARGYDRNIKDEVLSTKNINYDWLCTNQNNLQPCKTDENQIIQFPSKRVVDVVVDNQNVTFAFYVKASKDQRWTVRVQLIVITNFNIEEEFVLNQNNSSLNYINPNDEITILTKNNQQFAFVMQNFKILFSQKIIGQTIKFRLSDQSIDIVSPVYIYLLPGKESLSFKLNDPPQKVIFQVTPQLGRALEQFNYTIKNLGVNTKASIYYYFSNSTLTNDILLQQVVEGIPLIIESQQLEGAFQLPNGISNEGISLLCVIQSEYGTKSYFTQQVQVERHDYEIKNLIKTLNNKTNFSDLNSLHTMTVQLQLEQQQVCLKQCSGVGTCINNKCQCPPGYYFDDCSGDVEEYHQYLEIIKQSIYNLISFNITNNDNFKQYSSTLHYFSQFDDLLQNLTAQQCQNILQQYISNMDSRLVQINQYQINIQHYSTQDYNYSEIDTRSIVNKNDLYLALNSTVFMWNKTLFQEDSNIYQLQNYMHQLIQNIIELSLVTLNLEEETTYPIDTAQITIIKTSDFNKYVNFTNSTNERLLTEKSANNIFYSIIVSVYLRNFYAYDGYFPYPDQIYPLYDNQIRYLNRKENIKLQKLISYKFKITNNAQNLVCVTRNETTYYWSDQYCSLDQIDTVYFCNCSLLAPTTIISDINYIYSKGPSYQLKLPNILLILYGVSCITIIGFALKGRGQFSPRVSAESNENENYKYGRVLGLIKNRVALNFNFGDQQQKHVLLKSTREQKGFDSQNKNTQQENKFSFNKFWSRHFLFRLILKQLSYLNLKYRSLLLISRYTILILQAEIIDIYWSQDLILLTSSILIGSIIFFRVYEKFIQKQIKQSYFLQNHLLLFFQKAYVLLLFIFALGALIYFYFFISEDQTNIIISYSIAVLWDFLILDLLLFCLNKFLGEGKKNIIREKIKQFSKIKNIKQTENS